MVGCTGMLSGSTAEGGWNVKLVVVTGGVGVAVFTGTVIVGKEVQADGEDPLLAHSRMSQRRTVLSDTVLAGVELWRCGTVFGL